MNEARDELRSAVLWIEALTDGLLMPEDRRARLALGCLAIARPNSPIHRDIGAWRSPAASEL
jgi:hypothetical protein